MPTGIYKRKRNFPRANYRTKFKKNVEELRKFIKENDIRLLGLLEYIRKRNHKKVRKETINAKNNS